MVNGSIIARFLSLAGKGKKPHPEQRNMAAQPTNPQNNPQLAAQPKPPAPPAKTPPPPVGGIDRAVKEYRSEKRDQWLGSGTPWYTEGAKAWLDANILPTDNVLEFGGGRSTIFWATRAGRLTCVEASPNWFLWVYMHLYEHPDLLKRVRLHFIPCEWNPNFESGRRRYWLENRPALNTQDVFNLERDLVTANFPGHNVITFDGSLRKPVFVYQLTKANFDEIELIVIDNAEDAFNSYLADRMIPPEFTRLDFVAGSRDEVPPHQKGKHITTVFAKKRRAETAAPVRTETPTTLTEEERRPFMFHQPWSDDDVARAIEDVTLKINDLVGGGFKPRLFR